MSCYSNVKYSIKQIWTINGLMVTHIQLFTSPSASKFCNISSVILTLFLIESVAFLFEFFPGGVVFLDFVVLDLSFLELSFLLFSLELDVSSLCLIDAESSLFLDVYKRWQHKCGFNAWLNGTLVNIGVSMQSYLKMDLKFSLFIFFCIFSFNPLKIRFVQIWGF